MRRALLIIVATSSALAQDVPLGIEHVQDLGHGFRLALIAEQNPPNGFEAVGHFQYLFYRDRRLARANECAVAPSGKSIVYQDAPSGNIFMFRATDGTSVQLTKKFPGLVERYRWHEPEGAIDAFVIPSSTSQEPGKWISLAIDK